MELKKVSFGKGGKSSSIIGSGIKGSPAPAAPAPVISRPVAPTAPPPPPPAAIPTAPTASTGAQTPEPINQSNKLSFSSSAATNGAKTSEYLRAEQENKKTVQEATLHILNKASQQAITYIIEHCGVGQEQAGDVLTKYKNHIKDGGRGSTLAIISKDENILSKRFLHSNIQRTTKPLCVLPFASQIAPPRSFYEANPAIQTLCLELEIVFLATLETSLFTIAGQDHFILDASIQTLQGWLAEENSKKIPVIESILVPMEEMTKTLNNHFPETKESHV